MIINNLHYIINKIIIITIIIIILLKIIIIIKNQCGFTLICYNSMNFYQNTYIYNKNYYFV